MVINNGSVFSRMSFFTTKLACNINATKFPFDTQFCPITFYPPGGYSAVFTAGIKLQFLELSEQKTKIIDLLRMYHLLRPPGISTHQILVIYFTYRAQLGRNFFVLYFFFVLYSRFQNLSCPNFSLIIWKKLGNYSNKND